MDVLKAELEKRKREAEILKQSVSTSATPSAQPKKWMRRGEVEAMKASSAATQAEGVPSSSAGPEVQQITVGESSAAKSTSARVASEGLSHHAMVLSLPKSDVLHRLRKLGQVATYFGENDSARAERLYRYELEHVSEREDVALSGGFELSTKRRDGAGTVDYEEDTSPAQPNKRQRLTGGDVSTTGSSLAAAAGIERGNDDDGEGSVGSGGSKSRRDRGRTTSADADAYANGGEKHKYVYKYFKGLLNEWEEELGARPDSEKTSPAGIVATRMLKQCKDFVRPFLKQCRAKSVPRDILSLSAEMVDHCRARNYHMACDAYIRMAIGNAAWPIGVSAVGLHERAARQKVAEGIQAHVMNDEAQRKYITTLKRLVSFAQGKYPTDPSRMMSS